MYFSLRRLSCLETAGKMAMDARPVLRAALDKATGAEMLPIASAALCVGAVIPTEKALALYNADPKTMRPWFLQWAEYCNPQIIAILRDEVRTGTDGWHVACAANGLGQMGPPAALAVKDLIGAMDHPASQARRYAARALSMMGVAAREALPKMEQLSVRDPDKRVQKRAAQAATALAAACKEQSKATME